jgi:polygalacturonase/pectin methylesterase-like acyl-CoA thioesterase
MLSAIIRERATVLFVGALLIASSGKAQLQWSEYADKAETVNGQSYAAGQLIAASAGSGGDVTSGGSTGTVTFTVPAGAAVNFGTSNFTPFTLSGSAPSAEVGLNFVASGGLSGVTTRVFAMSLVNSTGSTLLQNGYTAIMNTNNSPQSFEFYVSPLAGGTAAPGQFLTFNSATKLSSSKTTGVTFTNATTYTGLFQINDVSGNVQIGTSSAGANAGASMTDGTNTVSGDGTKGPNGFANPTFTVNTFVFSFLNTTSSPVTLTLGGLTLVPIGAPTIQTPPSNEATSVGGPVTFTVASFSNPPGTIQWTLAGNPLSDGTLADGSVVSGSATSSLTISNAQLDENNDSVVVTITNSDGSAASSPVTLSVSAASTPPGISSQPANTSVDAGATATFTAVASGSPAPTYQWYFIPIGGSTAVTLTDGNGISGSTSGTLTLSTVNPQEGGSYYAIATNQAGNIQSSSATLTVVNAGPSIASVSPTSTTSNVPIDTPLTITFSDSVVLGTTGTVKIYNALTSALVDTIDLSQSSQTAAQIQATEGIDAIESSRTIEGQSFNYYPIMVSGATATITPHQALSYGTSYYVTIDTGVFLDASSQNSFVGIFDNATWTFSTKASGPASGAAQLVVATDDSGDFASVQGALDSLPSGNITPVTILIQPGIYNQLVFDNARSNVTFLGQSRAATVLEYLNNNNFDSAGGSFYHRGAVEAYGSNLVFANLTVRNLTPHGGSQAEALIVQGSQEILEQVSLYSFQDTLQINGSAYIADSYIQGDVDFMWGQGPNFFFNDEVKAVTSNGYYAQIRNNQPNGTANHGNVYVNCTVDAASGVTGSYLARIDPTVFPYSEVVYINCRLGANINPQGWLLNNATSAPTINFAYAGLTDSNGNAYNTSTWLYAQPITDSTILANYQTPSYILGGWNPRLAPIFLSQPSAASVPGGQTATFSASVAAVPTATFQWFLNGTALNDGTQSDGSVVAGSSTGTLTIQNVGDAETGAYTVQATSGTAVAASNPAQLTVTVPLPAFTTEPTAATAAAGDSASFSAAATNAASYQWYYDGVAITGNATATTGSLTVSGVTPASAGNYSVVATDASGSTSSSDAALAVTAGAGQPTLPVIPNGVFLVTAYGAAGDGQTDNTVPIQNAINAAIAAGGGTVEIPAASAAYLCGPITLGSNLNFQVDGGATLQALPYASYPNNSSNAADFVSASGATNLMISGAGDIDGNGQGWWTALSLNSSLHRPKLVKFSGCTNVLAINLTLSNGPTEHFTLDAGTDVTIDAITISAPATSPNTDGIDPAGTNYLIENCTISDGDDNIAIKPQNSFCSNFVIANCAFGVGHGLSIGGQTNDGLNGLAVSNCTFTGTTNGLRLKADSTEGGLVQNCSFTNLTMTGVTYPILFYSYYNLVGTPGAVSGSNQTTAAKVLSWNAAPPNSLATSTIPGWQNITLTNVTATGAAGYSVIWGVPLANGLISAITLDNVSISGGAGLEIYDAANVQLVNGSSVGPILTCNSLAITGQPQNISANAGASASFTVATAGASGVNGTAPTYAWSFNGTPLNDGEQSDGSVVSGSATAALTIDNVRVTDNGSYLAVVSNSLDGYDVGSSALVPNRLPVIATSAAATLSVTASPAAIGLSNLSQVYDGSGEGATVTTNPTGLSTAVTYNGSSTLPVDVGTYAVVATITDSNYSGTASGNLVITAASASVSLSGLNEMYDGSPVDASATTNPAGLLTLFAYNGLPAAVVPPSDNLSTYAAAAGQTLYVLTTGASGGAVSGSNPYAFSSDVGSAAVNAGILTVGQTAVLQIQIQSAGFQIVGIATSGYTLGPIDPGTYVVTATVADPNYTGSASGTLAVVPLVVVASPPVLNGTVNGSIQQLDAKNATLAAGALMTGDLLVPGTPKVSLVAGSTYGGTIVDGGTVNEPAYTVTINRGASLRHVVTKVDPITLPTVATSPTTTGTRTVTLTAPAAAPNWATVANLTLSNQAGAVAVPPGTYNTFTVNGGTTLVLGVAGASAPTVYNLRSLSLNANATVQLAGPVILTVNQTIEVRALAGSLPANTLALFGSSTNPNWLSLNVSSGGLLLNGAIEFYGNVVAPTGTVTVDSGATLTGGVMAAGVSVAAGGVLQ